MVQISKQLKIETINDKVEVDMALKRQKYWCKQGQVTYSCVDYHIFKFIKRMLHRLLLSPPYKCVKRNIANYKPSRSHLTPII